ncbi:hypothetical protein ACIQV3_23115 [Streptomyces sp. NPDC099050]|uniref:hypothetical protein n=1 Tax=Streptomyces sp. NPDC099050 TaxID=3366100 RepID=UPI0038241C0E
MGDSGRESLHLLRAADDDLGVRRIVLDVSRATFADSTMLILLRTGRLVLAGPVPPRQGRVLGLAQA